MSTLAEYYMDSTHSTLQYARGSLARRLVPALLWAGRGERTTGNPWGYPKALVVIRTSKDLIFVENEVLQSRTSNSKAGWKGLFFLSQPLLFGGKVNFAVTPPCVRYTYSCGNTGRNCMTTAEKPWQRVWYKKQDKYISKFNLTHFSIGQNL